ncbi:PD40 domain-containing protein [Candidatus Bipolaricaulota bacterium]|nr:PD40 domain-containing protein [Candidatus Bipolaricaulota bacterium]
MTIDGTEFFTRMLRCLRFFASLVLGLGLSAGLVLGQTPCGSPDGWPRRIISWDDAHRYVGETVVVEGPVVATTEDPLVGITYLDLGNAFPNRIRVTVCIPDSCREEFVRQHGASPAEYLKGKTIRVYGRIEQGSDGAPTIPEFCDPGCLLVIDTDVSQEVPGTDEDEDQIVFQSHRDGNTEIYIMNADGSDQRNLTNHPAGDYLPVWSPDRTRIAFTSNRDDNFEIYVMDADGGNQRRLTNHPAEDVESVWTPDGTQIAFTSNRNGGRGIYVMNHDGSDVRLVTKGDDAAEVLAYVSWSPDGEWLLYNWSANRYSGSLTQLRMIRPDGTESTVVRLSPAIDWPRNGNSAFSPDGSRIVFVSISSVGSALLTSIRFLDLKSHESWALSADVQYIGPSFMDHCPSWSPDGEKLCFYREDERKGYYIYTVDLNGQNYTRITSSGKDRNPCWSSVLPIEGD